MADIKVAVVKQDTGEVALRPKTMPDFSTRSKEIGDSLDEIAKELRSHLHELGQRRQGWDLDEVTLGFSLDLEAEAGVIIGRVSSKAGFQATLSWKRTDAAP